MKTLKINDKESHYFDISETERIEDFPYSLRVLLESLIRQKNDKNIDQAYIQAIKDYLKREVGQETVFLPSRVVLQDFTGVPAIVDLAAMRDAMLKLGKNPELINPEIPVDLVIDHSVQVDFQGNEQAFLLNSKKEFERNCERYEFLKWAEQSFDNFRVVPPATGIIHQVNIEYLSEVISEKDGLLYPDSVFGTDSHTTMINALGVLGWGVGGIEAEAVMLGEPSSLTVPEVVGVRLIGKLGVFATATDLALTVTKILRDEKVVGKFVEFFGEGLKNLSLADRATIANMAPEYAATCGYFPIDNETLKYLRATNRSEEIVARVEAYAKANKLFYDDSYQPHYSKVIDINLEKVETRLSGPSRPQDMLELGDLSHNFEKFVEQQKKLKEEDGKIAIAAITSCTNTSNPHVMMMAGLLAKNAVEQGLEVPSWVKTSLAPGSKVVSSYLDKAGLLPYLETLGFNVIGYGCTTCIGNSGPLLREIEKEITDKELVATSVLSGNRNFEGRIHPLVKANYLASPPLVVAYALAGSVRKNLTKNPLGTNLKGEKVYLKDILLPSDEVDDLVQKYVTKDLYAKTYAKIFDENTIWNDIQTKKSQVYNWKTDSTYISNPPYFDDMTLVATNKNILSSLQVLAKFGDSITTDHISPAGNIPLKSPAGDYLRNSGITYKDFNSFGSRRGNDKVMTRGTFANIRIKNQLVAPLEGGYSKFDDEILSIYEVAQKYKEKGVGLIVLAGKDYGMGSSRDWAAKGTKLLGVKAVIAESFERIHRSNLVMMGILPLQFLDDQNAKSLGLTGDEVFSIDLPVHPKIHEKITVQADEKKFQVLLRFDSQVDLDYYTNDGIMPYVIRKK
ncbi:aconitate hydratase 1 [Lactococcus lactis]|uniref:aconitate hydratase AcnA n=1 Tax=Lactococcus lactis subsp. cremoris TaxID=1359 RepID=UPI0007D94FCA|nr:MULTISPECIES: aconitate hydratase AcnA [Lactococcus]AXN64850.1 aconitate hydratase [Lactococcus cremoris]MRM51298.1 aconitate hydratase AcnA [Lactococcus cremoris]OAJ98460.1 aconitate hydratase 1 [Lactococcus lactis]